MWIFIFIFMCIIAALFAVLVNFIISSVMNIAAILNNHEKYDNGKRNSDRKDVTENDE